MKNNETLPLFNFEIVDHKQQWHINEKRKFDSYLCNLNDGKYEVIIRKWHPHRVLKQNGYYWKLISILANEFGYDKLEMHGNMLDMHAPKNEIDGEMMILRSSQMNTVEFGRYIDQIKIWASNEYQIPLPEPHEIEF